MAESGLKRVALVSFEDDRDDVASAISREGYELVEKSPELVVCYGGDGTVLYSERVFPGVPKLCLRKHAGCKTCVYDVKDLPTLLGKIKAGKYRLLEEMKLVMSFKNYERHALNEVQLHNRNPAKAIRFSLSVQNGELRTYESVVGDGVVISTPFGSRAYYYSVGGTPFDEGIGIAFNNPHNLRVKPFVVDENSVIRVRVIREEGYIIVDNDENFIEVGKDDEFVVRKSKQKARFVVME